VGVERCALGGQERLGAAACAAGARAQGSAQLRLANCTLSHGAAGLCCAGAARAAAVQCLFRNVTHGVEVEGAADVTLTKLTFEHQPTRGGPVHVVEPAGDATVRFGELPCGGHPWASVRRPPPPPPTLLPTTHPTVRA
jgi:hypothetical protein